jgi:uncharacterized protein DUF2628/zinc ribbon protein
VALIFCVHCGHRVSTNAPKCPRCGTPPLSYVQHLPLTSPSAPESRIPYQIALVSLRWQKIFEFFDQEGGRTALPLFRFRLFYRFLKRSQNLKFGDRLVAYVRFRFLTTSIWARGFGPFYYLWGGMWRQAISYTLFLSVIDLMIAKAIGSDIGSQGFDSKDASLFTFINGVFFAHYAKYDYYRKTVCGYKGWW